MSDQTIPITKESAEVFDLLTSSHGDNFALMSALFDGEPTNVICGVAYDGEDFYLTPIYVEVTESMFERLIPPETT